MKNLKTYVGSKLIQAEPMSKHRFNTLFKPDQLNSGDDQEGYHVVYPNPDGSKYHSWSPKLVFEKAYREITEGEVEMAMNHPQKEDGGDYEG